MPATARGEGLTDIEVEWLAYARRLLHDEDHHRACVRAGGSLQQELRVGDLVFPIKTQATTWGPAVRSHLAERRRNDP